MWKRLKKWTSRSFGCTSSYTIKDNDLPRPVNGDTKEASGEKSIKPSSKPTKVDAKTTDTGGKGINKVDANKNDLERSFSAKDAEDIPFMDASVVNIPQAMK